MEEAGTRKRKAYIEDDNPKPIDYHQPRIYKGYAFKLNGGHTSEKTARFVVCNYEETGLLGLSLDAYTALPCYSEFILYSIEARLSRVNSIFHVTRIIGCLPRFVRTGIPRKTLIKIFGRDNKDLFNSVPEFIRERKDILDNIPVQSLRDMVMNVCEPWFRGPAFFDLLRYFPASFLVRFKNYELNYLLELAMQCPYAFCFRSLLTRSVTTMASYKTSNGEIFPVFDSTPEILPSDRNHAIFAEDEILRTGYTVNRGAYYIRMEDKQLGYFVTNYSHTSPMWSMPLAKYFAEDHGLTIENEKLVFDSLCAYIICERRNQRDHSTFFDAAKNAMRPDIQKFLIDNGIMTRIENNPDESKAGSFAALFQEKTVSMSLVENDRYENELVHWITEIAKSTTVVDLDGTTKLVFEMMVENVLRGDCKTGNPLVVTSTMNQQYYISKSSDNQVWCVDSWLTEDERPEVLSNGEIDLVIFMAQEFDLAILLKCLRKIAHAGNATNSFEYGGNVNLFLVGTIGEKTTGNQDHYYVLEKLWPNVKRYPGKSEEIVARVEPTYKKLQQKKVGAVKQMHYKNKEAIVKEYCKWEKLKAVKGFSKQIFCSSPEMRTAMGTLFMAKLNLVYSPNVLYIGSKVRVHGLGFDGVILSAERKTKTGMWMQINDNKVPMFTSVSHYRFVIHNARLKIKATISTEEYTCTQACIETAQDYALDVIDIGVFFADQTTSLDELIKISMMCSHQFILYVERGKDVTSIFNLDTSIGVSGLTAKLKEILK